MNIVFSPTAWDQYLQWHATDKAIVKRINDLIEDIQRNGFSKGIGKPEPLKGRKAWSRRITQEHRFVYVGDDKRNLLILTCQGHYEE